MPEVEPADSPRHISLSLRPLFYTNAVKRRGIAWFFIALAFLNAQTPVLRDAINAIESGDFQAAERSLRREVAARPNDALALSLLGATLDNQNRTAEAAEFHRRALAIAPESVDVLNSDAAHLSMVGNDQEARRIYLRVIAIDAANRVANLQLARLALKIQDASAALGSLNRMAAQDREAQAVLLLRLQALYLSGDTAGGEQLFGRLSEMARTDLGLSSALVNALSSVRQFGHAETVCANTLQTWPSNFKVLYSLGVMATFAGHYQRARAALETAIARQPDNVDVLYALARADAELRQWDAAVALLARAGQLDPQRPDVQRLLAVATTELGALNDAATAWDRYLKLAPQDNEARRERSYVDVQHGLLEQGIAGLEQSIVLHPGDAIAHYELGQAQRQLDPGKALAQFDRAIEIDPDYVAARSARGSLLCEADKFEAARKDLESASSARPDDADILDRLGQCYASSDRTADAIRVLRRAAEIDPENSQVLFHLGRVLADAGDTAESDAVLARFRQARSRKPPSVLTGLVDYLSLPEAQRHADYTARVEKEASEHREDAAAQAAWLKLQIERGDWDRVSKTARAIVTLNPKGAVLIDAARALLAARQYSLALELMEHLPESERGSEYYLARAETLGASGKIAESVAAIDRGLISPSGIDFYHQAAALLVRVDRIPDAMRVVEQGARLFPGSRSILLLQVESLELGGQTSQAEGLLADVQSRWPEWYPVWVVRGAILKAHRRSQEASQALQTASELGAPADVLTLDLKGLLASPIVPL